MVQLLVILQTMLCVSLKNNVFYRRVEFMYGRYNFTVEESEEIQEMLEKISKVSGKEVKTGEMFPTSSTHSNEGFTCFKYLGISELIKGSLSMLDQKQPLKRPFETVY